MGFTEIRRVRTYRKTGGIDFAVMLCTYVRSILHVVLYLWEQPEVRTNLFSGIENQW